MNVIIELVIPACFTRESRTKLGSEIPGLPTVRQAGDDRLINELYNRL